MFWKNVKRRWKMFFTGLGMTLLGGFLFLRWQRVKVTVTGSADLPLISGYAVSGNGFTLSYPIYQVLGLTGLLTLFLGLVMLVLSQD